MTYHPSIYWSEIVYNDWQFYLAATQRGVCYASSEPFDAFVKWIESRFPHGHLIQNHEKVNAYLNELLEYWEGNRDVFTLPLDLRGTPFQISVWEALCRIPFGETRTYSQIAEHIGKPKAVRAVGAAIGANPVLIMVPCHRVIGKNGALTGFRCGIKMKKRLLERESISFHPNHE